MPNFSDRIIYHSSLSGVEGNGDFHLSETERDDAARNATQSLRGLMSPTDKTNLDNNTSEVSRINDLYDTEGDPTGFISSIDVAPYYDTTLKTIRIDELIPDKMEAYFNGRIVSGIIDEVTSPAHPSTLDKLYFLYHDGDNFIWRNITDSGLSGTWNKIHCAQVWNGTSHQFGIKECHEIMPWRTHIETHDAIGTYLSSGGGLGDYTTESSTPADRRPSFASATLKDEDCYTENPALSAGGPYTLMFLTGTESSPLVDWTTGYSEIISVNGSNPYYNQLTGGSWTQTLLAVGNRVNVYVLLIPTTSDSHSQQYSTCFLQGQNVYSTDVAAQSESINSVNLGNLTGISPEFIIHERITLRYIGGNWVIVSVTPVEEKYRSAQTVGGGHEPVTLDPSGESYLSLSGQQLSAGQIDVTQHITGIIPSGNLPSYVDDVLEYADLGSFPVTGETGKIYIALDTNYIYRWSGSAYIQITDQTAVWGQVSGTLSNQTDLQSALDGKEPAFAKNTAFNKNFGTASGTVTEGNDSRLLTDIQKTDLTDGGDTSLHTHTSSGITGLTANELLFGSSTGNIDQDSNLYYLTVSGLLKLLKIQLQYGNIIDEFSIDGTLSGNSNTAVPTEQAVKTAITNATKSPSFHVHRNGTDQSLTSGVLTKVDWTTEIFDTNNDFDLSNDRFIPTVSGKYLVVANIRANGNDTGGCQIRIRKNGSDAILTNTVAGENFNSASGVIDMNGTTDYIEVYVTVVGSGSVSINGAISQTNFSGSLVSHQ